MLTALVWFLRTLVRVPLTCFAVARLTALRLQGYSIAISKDLRSSPWRNGYDQAIYVDEVTKTMVESGLREASVLHYGNSPLFRADIGNDDPEQMLQLIKSLSKISPILDFALMDIGNRGDGRRAARERVLL